ncbi:MAG TPA: hypothetical protein VGJ22_02410 [Anaerolineales bacterium]|jgi:hypothetical protein
MTTPPQQPDRSGFRSEDDIDKVLGSANPNPERVGCPPHDVLVALAKRERPIGDPGYEHIVNCSPCYREFRSLQQANAVGPSRKRRNSRVWFAAAAAVVIVTVGTWYTISSKRARPGPETARPAIQVAELQTQLDLRKYSVARSESGAGKQPVLDLPRGRLDLTILLPVGSEPGAYEVQLLDSDLRSRANATGTAEIRNYITTVRTALDIRDLPSGSYQLAVRRQGEEWQMFPARLP